MNTEPSRTGERRRSYIAAGFWSATETLQARISATAAESPERLAAVDAHGATLTYAELDERANHLASGLRQLGVHDGVTVGMQLPNQVDALVAMSGIERAGGIVCPLMPMFRAKELGFIARAGGMKVLLQPGVYRGFDYDAMAGDLIEGGLIEHAISLSDAPNTRGVKTFAEVISLGAADVSPLPDVDPEADAALMFTSGTTGTPKGVLHNQNTMLAGNRILSRALDLNHEDCIFVPAVVGHGTGYIWGMRFALYLGTRCVLLDRWTPSRGAELLAQERCTWTMVAPAFVQDLLDASEREHVDMSSLRYLSCGGAAPPTHLHSRVRENLDCDLLRLYGQTEAFLSTHCLPDDPTSKLVGTEGRPLPGTELKVLAENGDEAVSGTPGELLARGPHRCVGLLTSEGLRRLDPDEWIPSGDLAAIDADGYLSIRGRIKEFINRGGFKYSPVEIEDLLHEHPAIARVAIVAMPDRRLGERGCACVVLADQGAVTLEDIVEYLETAGVAPFKWPERLELFDDLPRTPSGKVQKHVLHDLVAKRDGSEVVT